MRRSTQEKTAPKQNRKTAPKQNRAAAGDAGAQERGEAAQTDAVSHEAGAQATANEKRG